MRSLRAFILLLVSVVTVFLSCGYVLGKECTNIPTQLSSHGVRYELLSSNNETWKEEMFSHYHLIPTDDSAWSNLLPRKVLREDDELEWLMMYRKMKNSGGFQNLQGDFLKEVSLHDVRLDPESKHGQAQQTNLEYLLILDGDSLVWSFRKTAGLPTPGKAYGGWEALTCELRGHFVGWFSFLITFQYWFIFLSLVSLYFCYVFLLRTLSIMSLKCLLQNILVNEICEFYRVMYEIGILLLSSNSKQ